MNTKTRRGLGRGIDALIPSPKDRKEPILSTTEANESNSTVTADKSPYTQSLQYNQPATGASQKGRVAQIAVDLLEAGPYQPRDLFDQQALEELASSIKRNGIIQPILVTTMHSKGKHSIIAGERRWRAGKIAGLDTIPAIIRDLTDTEAMEIALVENVQRQDLTIIEEAEGYKRLIEEFNYTQDKLAKMIGKSRSHITNILRLLALPDEVKKMLNEDKISMGHARALLTADNPTEIANAIVARGLNVRQVESLMRKNKTPTQDEDLTTRARSFDQAIEKQMQAHIQSRVTFKSKLAMKDKQSGNISVHFKDLKELDKIISLLAD